MVVLQGHDGATFLGTGGCDATFYSDRRCEASFWVQDVALQHFVCAMTACEHDHDDDDDHPCETVIQ